MQPNWKRSGGPSIQRNKFKPAKLRYQTFDDLDLRTVAARRAQDIVTRLVEDLGGPSNVSTAERQLVQHAAVLAAYIEDQEVRFISGHKIEVQDLLAAVNTQRRLLVTVGLQRRSKDVTPTLAEYIRKREEELAAEEVEE